jgi:hypothetical protein
MQNAGAAILSNNCKPTNAAPISSTVQGGGKRRAGINIYKRPEETIATRPSSGKSPKH